MALGKILRIEHVPKIRDDAYQITYVETTNNSTQTVLVSALEYYDDSGNRINNLTTKIGDEQTAIDTLKKFYNPTKTWYTGGLG